MRICLCYSFLMAMLTIIPPVNGAVCIDNISSNTFESKYVSIKIDVKMSGDIGNFVITVLPKPGVVNHPLLSDMGQGYLEVKGGKKWDSVMSCYVHAQSQDNRKLYSFSVMTNLLAGSVFIYNQVEPQGTNSGYANGHQYIMLLDQLKAIESPSPESLDKKVKVKEFKPKEYMSPDRDREPHR